MLRDANSGADAWSRPDTHADDDEFAQAQEVDAALYTAMEL